MPVTLPPPCTPAELTDPRFIQHPTETGYGAIVHCRPAFECRRWPVAEPIPPDWVEVPPDQQDNLLRLSTGVYSCRITILPHEGSPEPVRAVPPRLRPSPARARAERAPRKPRPRRRARAAREPRPPRAPRKPREPRPPRTPRSTRTPAKIYPSWHGWTVPGILALVRFPKGISAIPEIGEKCIYDYYDTQEGYVATFRSLGSDAEIRKWLRQHSTGGQLCAGEGDRSLCSITIGEIANVLDTLQQITHGIPQGAPPTEAQLARIKKVTTFAAPTAPGPGGPVEPPPPPPPPTPTGFAIWVPINVGSIIYPSGPGGRVQTTTAFYSNGGIPAPGYFVVSFSPTDPGLPSYG